MFGSSIFALGGLNSALAGMATLIATAFTLSTADRWLRRRQPHELAWTIAMFLFALGSASLWWAESVGWNIFVFRLFFLCGAVLNVAWLALGTIYLLGGQRLGNRIRAWLIWLSGFATGIMLVAEARSRIVPSEFPTGKEVFGVAPRTLAAIGSGVPALVIIVGALWSAYRIIRRRNPALSSGAQRSVVSAGQLAGGNILIATGTLILSASGSLAGRFGEDRAFVITLLIGVLVLFLGFLVASNSTRTRSVQRASQYLARAASW